MDAYSNYNQISMFEADRDNRAFMTKWANYWYNFMPFGLKNAREPFQKMMNKIFMGDIGEKLGVYSDDIIIKFGSDELHK